MNHVKKSDIGVATLGWGAVKKPALSLPWPYNVLEFRFSLLVCFSYCQTGDVIRGRLAGQDGLPGALPWQVPSLLMGFSGHLGVFGLELLLA